MAKALFSVFFKVIKGIATVILTPINALVSNLFPDFSNLIATFNTAVGTFLTGSLNYFFHILPPNCRTFVLLWLTLLIAFYTFSITAHAILKVYTIIKNIKIW